MSHDLAHSTGLPKPPGYNLEWPRLNPIQVTLVTGPPAKASHHDLHPKLCRIPPRDQTLHPKPSGAPLASLGGTWFQTACRTRHAARHHTLFRASTRSFLSGKITFSARRHAFQASLVFPYHLAAHPK